MEFKSQAHQQVYEKLPLDPQLFGTFAFAREDVPSFGLAVGSAFVRWVSFPGEMMMPPLLPAPMWSPGWR